jgi:hypothetical protein
MSMTPSEQPFLFVKWYHLDAVGSIIHHVPCTLTLADAPRKTRVHVQPDLPDTGEEDDRRVRILQMVMKQATVNSTTRDILEGRWTPSDPAGQDMRSHSSIRSYPPEYRNEMTGIESELDISATQSWELLSWRLNILGALPPAPRTFSLSWQHGRWTDTVKVFDGWNQIPSGITTLEMPHFVELDISEDVLRDLSLRFLELDGAPLGHSLLREAERLLQSEIRSTIIVAVASVETAVKKFIADLAPDTAWLLDELSSPPVVKLLTRYVPELSRRRQYLGRPPRHIVVALEAAVALRNRIVHGRSADTSRNQVEQLLSTLRDILFALDYARGETWALEHISSQTKSAWSGLVAGGGA